MSDTAQSALVQANDYLVVGSTANALNVLRDFILDRASKTWELAYETLMIKYVDLCVLLKHTDSVSKVFHQYRNICHQANIISLEKVIFHFLEIIEERIKEEMVKQNITSETLERSKDREETYLLAQFGSGSLTHDQGSFDKIHKRLVDKEDLKQFQVWCQYIWKIYHYMIENIKFTQYLEDLYCKIAKDTFRFCREYKRINETRQLSTILSQHLSKLENYQNQKQNIILTNQESLTKLLDLRFTQLETQFALKKWQDIYHTFGSINSLHNKYNAVLDPETEIKYFEKLSEFLWLTGFKKLHSFALRILYEKSRKTLEKSENLELSSQLLLSSLVIPFERQNEKSSGLSPSLWKEASETRKVSNLSEIFLGEKNDMIRKDHVNYLNRKNISNLVYPELKNIYQLIENTFDPLNLFTKAIPTFEFIGTKPQLSRYLSSLKKQILNKFFIEISQIYTTISFDYLIQLLPTISLKEIFQYLIEQSKDGKLNLVIDHKNKIVRFHTVDVQNINIRDQLSNLAHDLSSLIQLTEMEGNKGSKSTKQQSQETNKDIEIEKDKETETETERETETSNEEYNPERFEHELKTENYLLQSRLDQIEERRLSKIKELEKIKKQKREKEIAEKEKIKRLEQLEKERIAREKQKKEDRILYNKLISICTVQEARQFDFEKMTRKNIEEAQKKIEEKREEEKLEKKKQEYIDKFCNIAKHRDYFERAARELEIEKIKTIVLKKDQLSKVEYENKKKSIREEAKMKFDQEIQRKKLFVPYFDLSEQFKIKFLKRQQEIYDGRVLEERKKYDERKDKIREQIELKEQELEKIIESENKKREERIKMREELEKKKQQLKQEKQKETETKTKTDQRTEKREKYSSKSSSKSGSKHRKETEKERRERKERERRRENERERERDRRREKERTSSRHSSKSSSKSGSKHRKETEKERRERKERERRREKERERERDRRREKDRTGSSSRHKSSSSSSSSKYKDYDREKDGRRDRDRDRERTSSRSGSGSSHRSSSRYNESEGGSYRSSRDYNNYDRRQNDRYNKPRKDIDEEDNWRKKK
ncbi:eukaryotic translation initiation factor 3 theta subunit [Anaeramoeba flamelloides]|uniref:Eukaryotic translation initiation factor 3 theta subunit n=1 Tax=Anaeramoeba flamelloides TaxID=1746091 RepID=A0AAV7ZU37_9EUKA|nr:eukaryotic translation initiation factor 3 theta subunit [Anaeramoeba flamelloides]